MTLANRKLSNAAEIKIRV